MRERTCQFGKLYIKLLQLFAITKTKLNTPYVFEPNTEALDKCNLSKLPRLFAIRSEYYYKLFDKYNDYIEQHQQRYVTTQKNLCFMIKRMSSDTYLYASSCLQKAFLRLPCKFPRGGLCVENSSYVTLYVDDYVVGHYYTLFDLQAGKPYKNVTNQISKKSTAYTASRLTGHITKLLLVFLYKSIKLIYKCRKTLSPLRIRHMTRKVYSWFSRTYDKLIHSEQITEHYTHISYNHKVDGYWCLQ